MKQSTDSIATRVSTQGGVEIPMAGRQPTAGIKLRLQFLYACITYLLGLASLMYLLGFIAAFGVPKDITSGPTGPIGSSILINMSLVMLFGLQHSLMARQKFKRWWTRWCPASLERATYLLVTAAITALLVWCWQPLPQVLWSLTSNWAITAISLVYCLTWALMLLATFQFGHLDFFGVAQAWRSLRSRPAPETRFSARYLYALIRHPISLGWMVTPWLVPTFTLGHLVFALASAAYILLATPFEERDLIKELGDEYTNYRLRVAAFFPIKIHYKD